MQASLISCELSPARGAWRAVQAAFEEFAPESAGLHVAQGFPFNLVVE